MQYYNVARIVNTHGIKGTVKVVSSTDFPEDRFKKGAKLALFLKETDQQPTQILTVARATVKKGTYLIDFTEFNNINDVEKFKGAILKVDETNLTDLAEDEFYTHDIIGLAVLDEGKQEIGTVKEVLQYGPNDVWVVARPNQNDLLLPYIESVVKLVELDKKQVIVEVPAGLDD